MKKWAKILILYIVFIAGCTNPFSTRTPEDPDLSSTQPTSFNLQNDPNTLLAKIQQTYEFKDSKSYKDCFANPSVFPGGFLFIPDQNEASRLTNWILDDEERYFTNLVNKFDVVFDFNPEQAVPQPIPGTSDTMLLEFDYIITASDGILGTERYEGRSVMRLLKTPQEIWFIYRWLDLQEASKSDSTWSTLKANFRISS